MCNAQSVCIDIVNIVQTLYHPKKNDRVKECTHATTVQPCVNDSRMQPAKTKTKKKIKPEERGTKDY